LHLYLQYVICSAARNTESIDQYLHKCGYYILVTSEKMSAEEALLAYSKRDCVEKVFMALKSFLGMDKIGTQTDESIHAKSLIWFVAAILHSLLFTGSKDLRVSDRKTFTVPSVVDLLEEINSYKNLMTSQYERRYKPNRKQSDILKALGISTTDIDDRISVL
jgi:transposase